MASDIVALLGVNLIVTLSCMVVLWSISTRTGDPSFVDAWWPMGFVVVAWISASLGDGDATRRLVLAVITTVWGLRLGAYLLWRWRRNGPDKRYVAMLRHVPGNPNLFTLRRVFLLQGALLWVVSLPLQLGAVYDEPVGLQALGYVGVAVCVLGIAFESIGDAQLTCFKRDPAHEGRVMDRGLWRYTRHPNYFGDACTWWGLFLIAVVNPVTFVAIVGPIVMTILLVRYSGARLLERRLLRHKPDYADYVARTSAFVPLPPRRPVGVRRPA